MINFIKRIIKFLFGFISIPFIFGLFVLKVFLVILYPIYWLIAGCDFFEGLYAIDEICFGYFVCIMDVLDEF